MRDTRNWGGTILRLCRQNFLRVRKLNAFLKKFTFQGLNNLNLYKILYTNIKFYHPPVPCITMIINCAL